MFVWLFGLSLASDAIVEARNWATNLPQRSIGPPIAEAYAFAGPATAHLLDRALSRPGVVQVEVYGHSVSGAPLVAFHITEPTVPVREELLVFAGLHALEWIGSQSAWEWADLLIDRPPRGVRVTIVPLANPDGRARVERDLIEGRTDVYRRGNQNLVDLNRDFAVGREAKAMWRHVIPSRYGTSPAPLSQPESVALDALMGRQDYQTGVSLHAFGGYLYHPWSSTWEPPADWTSYVEAGRQMEQAQGSHAYRTRQLSRWGFFFRAHGTELDHMQGAHGMQAWLFEITRSGLRRPSDRRTPFLWYNPRRPAPHVSRVIAALGVLIRGGEARQTPMRPAKHEAG